MYLNILLVDAKCDNFDFCMNFLTTPTLYARSGLVLHKYLSEPMSLLYCVGSIYASSIFFDT
jgi:hypothetical protein